MDGKMGSEQKLLLALSGQHIKLLPEDIKHHFITRVIPMIKDEIYATLSPYWRSMFEMPSKELDWQYMSGREDLTIEIIYSYARTHYDDPWDWKALSWNHHLNWCEAIWDIHISRRRAPYTPGDKSSYVQTDSGIGIPWLEYVCEHKLDWEGIAENPGAESPKFAYVVGKLEWQDKLNILILRQNRLQPYRVIDDPKKIDQ